VTTVQEVGWSGLKNGELPVSVVVLAARSNRMQDLRVLVPELLRALASLHERTLVQIGS
jgi:hypothetical protein